MLLSGGNVDMLSATILQELRRFEKMNRNERKRLVDRLKHILAWQQCLSMIFSSPKKNLRIKQMMFRNSYTKIGWNLLCTL